MEQICSALAQKYPCRETVIKSLTSLIGDAEECYPNAIYLYGHTGTGKTAITKELLRLCKSSQSLRAIQLNCIECYTTKILLENILDELALKDNENTNFVADNLRDFIQQLQRWHSIDVAKQPNGFIIALDNAERLRDMDFNILPALLQLQNLTGLNVCVLLISQLPFEKYYSKTDLSHVIILPSTQYTKAEALLILSADFTSVQDVLKARLLQQKEFGEQALEQRLDLMKNLTLEFFKNYLNVFLSVFYKACRDITELKLIARKCYNIYVEPVLNGTIKATDVASLWRHISGPLRTALTQVYMRTDKTNELLDTALTPSGNQTLRKFAQSFELPYYGKYLLIAAFLASHNSAKQDKRLFVKYHGKQRKRMQSVNAKAKVTEKLSTTIGPKSFSIDRLLAIFYAILDEKVGLTCNLLSQISTLVHLKLLNFVAGESNIVDGTARLQCTVGLEFVLYIGKVVGFNVRQYLCDFM